MVLINSSFFNLDTKNLKNSFSFSNLILSLATFTFYIYEEFSQSLLMCRPLKVFSLESL